jgi:chemotaxis protein MotB
MPPEEPKQGAPEWVVTFGDMMSLLLCFFVLLLSFSTLETERFKVVAGYIREAFGVQLLQRHTEIPSGNTVVATDYNPPNDVKQVVLEQLVSLLEDLDIGESASAELDEEGVRLTMQGGLLFRPGSADLQPEALPFLDEVAQMIIDHGGVAVVEGHTDNVPIRSARFPSNWELSGARAAAVVRRFEHQGVPRTALEPIGYADTRPIEDNLTDAHRRKNRRVEILIKTEE